MTCREKLKLERPERIGDNFYGGCAACPHTYEYMDKPDYCPNCGDDRLCSKCWDREIPGTPVVAIKSPIKFKIFFGNSIVQLNRGMTADDKANEWLAEHPNIEILQMGYQDAQNSGHSICIMYKE